jgi:phage shock protein C
MVRAAWLIYLSWDLTLRRSSEEGKMYCNYCGKVIPDDSNLCAYCGKRVAGVIARQRLVRPRQSRKIAGVCAGLAEYYDLDATLIRIVWAVCVVCGGVGLLAYIAAWYARSSGKQIEQKPPEGGWLMWLLKSLQLFFAGNV